LNQTQECLGSFWKETCEELIEAEAGVKNCSVESTNVDVVRNVRLRLNNAKRSYEQASENWIYYAYPLMVEIVQLIAKTAMLRNFEFVVLDSDSYGPIYGTDERWKREAMNRLRISGIKEKLKTYRADTLLGSLKFRRLELSSDAAASRELSKQVASVNTPGLFTTALRHILYEREGDLWSQFESELKGLAFRCYHSTYSVRRNNLKDEDRHASVRLVLDVSDL